MTDMFSKTVIIPAIIITIAMNVTMNIITTTNTVNVDMIMNITTMNTVNVDTTMNTIITMNIVDVGMTIMDMMQMRFLKALEWKQFINLQRIS